MKNLYYKLASLTLGLLLISYGAFILKPIVLGLLIAMLIYPAYNWLSARVKSQNISYFIIIFSVLIMLGGFIMLISFQIFDLFGTLESDQFSLENLRTSLESFLKNLGISSSQSRDFIAELIYRLAEASADVIPWIISNGSSLMVTSILGLIFSYFFSLYYLGLKEAMLDLFENNQRSKIRKIFDQVPDVTRKYLKGMSLVMSLLAIINTSIYFLIGLDYALVWGILSGLLALIPYIGSAIALLLPLSYSIIASEGPEQPLFIIFAFIIVQQLEGNFFTPKIVGDAVNINPFAAIVFMIVSGQIWGLFGIFISIMVAGILKIILEQWKTYHSIAALLSESIEEQ